MNEDVIKKITGEVVVALAQENQKKVKKMSFAKREQIIAKIRSLTLENAENFAKMAVEETGMGNVRDKIAKHRLVAEKTPGTEDITTKAWSGDDGLSLVEMSPFGVIGAITPSTNPSETVICNTIGMLAGGNTVVFSPHPGAMKASMAAIEMVNKAAEPFGVKIAFSAPSDVVMKHKAIPLIVATGGPGLVDAVLASGKRGIGAGAGNPPVLVDETADIKKAAQDIINGCTFDNNLPCIAEKSVVAIDSIASQLMDSFENCYKATSAELAKLESLVITPKGLNRACVGKSAAWLLEAIGVKAPNVRCIVFEGQMGQHLLMEELMMPILGMVRAKNFDDAVEKALILENGYGHSAHIHSKSIDRVTFYAKTMETAILVKNAPSYTGLGFGAEGFCSFTIASRTGEGLTSAATFTKQRRCVLGGTI